MVARMVLWFHYGKVQLGADRTPRRLWYQPGVPSELMPRELLWIGGFWSHFGESLSL